jgi:hypothetical protein
MDAVRCVYVCVAVFSVFCQCVLCDVVLRVLYCSQPGQVGVSMETAQMCETRKRVSLEMQMSEPPTIGRKNGTGGRSHFR